MSTPKMTPIDADIARIIAQRAYYATIENIARNQQLIVDLKGLINVFGHRALPPDKMLRGLPRQMQRDTKSLRELEERLAQSLHEDYRLAELLEERFDAQEAANMEAFARDMAARFRADVKAEKAKRSPEAG